jgi:hypothetical protein
MNCLQRDVSAFLMGADTAGQADRVASAAGCRLTAPCRIGLTNALAPPLLPK